MSEKLYAESVEYLYVSVIGFSVDGVPADPTTYDPEVAFIPPCQSRSSATWLSGDWVTVDGQDWIRILAGDEEPLVPGDTRVFVRLTGAPETIVKKAGTLSVE